MTIVVLGTNRIENCESVIAVGTVPVLQIEVDPVILNLDLPEKASSPLVIRRNEVVRGDVRVVQSPHDVSVISSANGLLICNVAQLDPESAAVHLDLRSFGLFLYTDAEGLHVGESVLAHNTIQGAKTAIALG